ncbi:MAG TPA: endonuclease III [bacterium]
MSQARPKRKPAAAKAARPAPKKTVSRGKPKPRARKPKAAVFERQGKRRSPEAVRRIFDALARALPDPKSELEYATPFELLVAVILSAQATDKSVNLATAKLYPVAHTPQAILALGEAGLLQYIRTIGLAPSKAKNIITTCGLLLARHGGEVPRTREELEALAGVGRKTANVVLNVAFGEHTLAVDTHVFRVGNRTGLAPGKTPLEVEQGLLKVVPPEHLRHAHHYLILHGRYTCTARSPQCAPCIIRNDCGWPDKTTTAEPQRTRSTQSH